LQLKGAIDSGEFASGTYHSELSTNLTGLIYSRDLTFEANQPLGVSVTLGDYVRSVPEWASLESQLRSLLDAGTPDNDFTLVDFSFPAVPTIQVLAGQDLIVTSRDTTTSSAGIVPEPGSYVISALSST
jgi:hypothetical protein